MKTWLATALLVLIAAASWGQPVRADEMLAAARDLYTSAEYERAWTILERLQADDLKPEEKRGILQYRAYCLIALGRAADAERAIAAFVAVDPLDRDIAAEMSPRVKSAFRDVRRRVLPGIVQERYKQAKAAFDAKDFPAAAAAFDLVLKAMADPDLESAVTQSPLADLRMLAVGFHDLSAQAATPAPLPVVSQMSVSVAAPPRPPRIYSNEDPGVVPPAPVRQQLPLVPAQTRTSGVPGVLELLIDETGVVESVIVRASISPRYDLMLVDAARKWTYQPATVQGVPVKYRKMVQVDVQH